MSSMFSPTLVISTLNRSIGAPREARSQVRQLEALDPPPDARGVRAIREERRQILHLAPGPVEVAEQIEDPGVRARRAKSIEPGMFPIRGDPIDPIEVGRQVLNDASELVDHRIDIRSHADAPRVRTARDCRLEAVAGPPIVALVFL